MTKNIKSISVHDGTLQMAKEIMEENGFRHLPVTAGKHLVGIISLSDIRRVSFGGNYDQEEAVDKSIFEGLSIGRVMAHEPTAITEDCTIKEAAEIITSNEFNALPVIKGTEIQGIVTSTDLIKYLLAQY